MHLDGGKEIQSKVKWRAGGGCDKFIVLTLAFIGSKLDPNQSKELTIINRTHKS